jgi:thiol-disulfide isomerase/thioredoxin
MLLTKLALFIIPFWAYLASANQSPVMSKDSNVKEVRILQDFYDKVNNNNYTLVKYYTTWCSHCKKLKPVFDTMSKEHTELDISALLPTTFFNKTFDKLPKFFDEKVNIDYVSVECEIFGSFEICKRWPGYPVIEFIPPNTETSIQISKSSVKEDVDEEEEMPTWLKVFTKIDEWFTSLFAGSMDLDDVSFVERSYEYKGSRTEPKIKDFISKSIGNDYERLLIDYLIANEDNLSKDDEILKTYREWKQSLSNKFIAVNEILQLLSTEAQTLSETELRDILFQKRILSTLIDLEEQERLRNIKQDEL